MAGIREQLREDLKTAMLARDAVRRAAIRFLEAAVKNAEIDKRAPLNEPEVLQLIQKQIKHREESVTKFRQGGRTDLAEKEEAEIGMLQAYLPAQLSREDVVAAAQATIDRVGAIGAKDKGKALVAELRGKTDVGSSMRS